jgi:hypothetical protein
MRKFILFAVLVFAFNKLSAQDTSRFLHNYNFDRIKTTKNAMVVLGGWGVANITAGLIGRSKTTGEARYFHEMNAIWGAVNLGIATASYLGNRKLNPDKYNWQQSIQEQRKIEKIYLINGGLDVAYIGGGIFLQARGHNRSNDQLKGYGTSLITQGAFLLLYDGINYMIHRHHAKKLAKKVNLF